MLGHTEPADGAAGGVTCESEQKLLGSCGDHAAVTGAGIKVLCEGAREDCPEQGFQNALCGSSFPW